jgi:uncharacterized membrane protein
MSSLLALLSALTFGVSDFLGGIATRRAAVWLVVFWSHVAGLLVALAAAPFLGGGLGEGTIVWGAIAGVAGAVGLLALYAGLAAGRMAVVAPVSAVVSAVVPAVAGLAMGDRLEAATSIGVVVAIPAIVLVSAGRSMRAAGLGNGLLAGLGFAGFFLALALAPDADGLWALVPARSASLAVVAAVLVGRRQMAVPRSADLRLLAAVGAGDMAANIFYLLAVQRGMLASTVVLTSLYPAVTVVLARAVVNEQISPRQWLGIAMTVAAVALIA